MLPKNSLTLLAASFFIAISAGILRLLWACIFRSHTAPHDQVFFAILAALYSFLICLGITAIISGYQKIFSKGATANSIITLVVSLLLLTSFIVGRQIIIQQAKTLEMTDIEFVSLLGSTNKFDRQVVANLLGEMGADAPAEALPALRKALDKETDQEARQAMMEAIEKITSNETAPDVTKHDSDGQEEDEGDTDITMPTNE